MSSILGRFSLGPGLEETTSQQRSQWHVSALPFQKERYWSDAMHPRVQVSRSISLLHQDSNVGEIRARLFKSTSSLATSPVTFLTYHPSIVVAFLVTDACMTRCSWFVDYRELSLGAPKIRTPRGVSIAHVPLSSATSDGFAQTTENAS